MEVESSDAYTTGPMRAGMDWMFWPPRRMQQMLTNNFLIFSGGGGGGGRARESIGGKVCAACIFNEQRKRRRFPLAASPPYIRVLARSPRFDPGHRSPERSAAAAA
nr:unnamed protein product [Digitaria exilis]